MQFGGMAVAPGVQMGGIPTVYAAPQYGGPTPYGGPPPHGQPAPQGYVVHQATVRPMQTPDAQPSAGPYAGPGSQDPGFVRYGRQSKVPMV